jgi:hypothetical protein
MMKLMLTDEERLELEQAFKTTTNARLRARCQAIFDGASPPPPSPYRRRLERQCADDSALLSFAQVNEN